MIRETREKSEREEIRSSRREGRLPCGKLNGVKGKKNGSSSPGK